MKRTATSPFGIVRNGAVLVGPEHLLPEAVSLGGTGGVNGGANVCPSLFCNLYQAAIDDDQAGAESISQTSRTS
ncbi:MAG: hypothetical protein R3C05_29335 [Pirellulaceae bacterium]